MARNDSRRSALADAAIDVLAREGSRGLTHRAVDRAGGAPTGTASNYFASRAALLEAVVARIYERLQPDAATLERLAATPPSRESYAAHLRDLVRRLTADSSVTLALFEMRLEAARRPEVAALMEQTLRAGFEGDIAYTEAGGLPGGPAEIALFHYAIDGLLLDRLTVSIDPERSTDDVVDALVDGLL